MKLITLKNSMRNMFCFPQIKQEITSIFVCKRFYIKILMDKLGIYSDMSNKASTYEEQYSPEAVTGDHTRSMNKFNINVTENLNYHKSTRFPNFIRNRANLGL